FRSSCKLPLAASVPSPGMTIAKGQSQIKEDWRSCWRAPHPLGICSSIESRPKEYLSMQSNPLGRRHFLRGLALSGTSLLVSRAIGQERGQLKEPVFRVAKAANTSGTGTQPGGHPLDPALEIAHDALVRIQRDVTDYTA